MVIVCDVDSVLNNLMDVIIDKFNNAHETSYTLDDITAFNLENCFDANEAHAMKEFFNDPTIWNSVKPIVKSQDGLQKLVHNGHQVYLITDNCPDTYGEKVKWIRHFYPFIEPSKIVCMKDKWMFGCDVMIEDCVQTLLARPYYHRILMDYPWNRNVRDYAYDIHRCGNWDEIVEAVNKINNEGCDVN